MLNAHARLRIARGELVAPVRLLHVLAQGKLHAGHRVGEFQFFRQRAPTELDHLVLAAHRIGRAVQDICRGDSAGQLAVNPNIRRIEHVADAHFTSDRVAALVHAFADRGVRMTIDDAWRDVCAFGVNNQRAGRNL